MTTLPAPPLSPSLLAKHRRISDASPGAQRRRGMERRGSARRELPLSVQARQRHRPVWARHADDAVSRHVLPLRSPLRLYGVRRSQDPSMTSRPSRCTLGREYVTTPLFYSRLGHERDHEWDEFQRTNIHCHLLTPSPPYLSASREHTQTQVRTYPQKSTLPTNHIKNTKKTRTSKRKRKDA